MRCTKSLLICGFVLPVLATGLSARTVTVLHSFNGTDGANPWSVPVLDEAGNLYGTTMENYGTVFRLSADGTFTTLYQFLGDADGAVPVGALALDDAGNLYGTTELTVFRVAPDGTETVLHTFAGGTDGFRPEAGIIRDKWGIFTAPQISAEGPVATDKGVEPYSSSRRMERKPSCTLLPAAVTATFRCVRC